MNFITLTSPCNQHMENLILFRDKWSLLRVYSIFFLFRLKLIDYGNLY